MTHVRDSDIVSARNWSLFTSDGAYKPRIMLDYGYRVGVEVVPRKGALDGGYVSRPRNVFAAEI
jgi:hypothetical protein